MSWQSRACQSEFFEPVVSRGSVSTPIVPALWIVAGVLGALVVGNVIDAWPGWVAGRVTPAVVMCNE
jgi:hypothetical protein